MRGRRGDLFRKRHAFEPRPLFGAGNGQGESAYFREIAKGVLFFVWYLPERHDFKGYGEIFVRE